MTEESCKRLNHAQLLALRGLRLPASVLKRLRKTGIYCEPAVSIEHQNLARRYVLRGVESGGAVAEVGAYCSFVDTEGGWLPWLRTIETVGVNGLHAVVLARAFVRVQVFRFGHTYDLLITSHILNRVEPSTRPRLENTVLFHGRQGTLALDLWGKERHLRGHAAPTFYGRNGEELALPSGFELAIRRAVAGACCIGCKSPQSLLAPGLHTTRADVVAAGERNAD